MENLPSSWQEWALIVLAAVTLFDRIAKKTPNTWDDKLAGKLLSLFSLGGGKK